MAVGTDGLEFSVIRLTRFGSRMATTVVHTPAQSSVLDTDDSYQSSLAGWSSEDSRRPSQPGSLLSQGPVPAEGAYEVQDVVLSRTRAVILIATLTGITFVGSMSGGLLTIGLPWIAADLNLAENLLLW